MPVSGPVLDFEVLFAALPAPHAVLATDGTVLYLNEALYKLLIDCKSVVNRPLTVLLAAAEAAKLCIAPAALWPAALVEVNKAGAKPVILEPDTNCDWSRGRCWQATLQLVPTQAPPSYILLRLLDVTEQVRKLAIQRESYAELQQARRELNASDHRLGQILAQSPALIAMLDGPEHRFRFTNPGYDRLTGNRAKLGLTAAECLPELVGQGFIDMLDTVYRTGESFVGQELPIALLDPVQGTQQGLFFDFNCQALRDGKGQILGILAFIIDVTDRALARQRSELLTEELRRSEDELRIQAESIPQQVWTAQSDGTINFYNQRTAAYLGYASIPDTAVDWFSYVHPDDQATVAERWAAAQANRRYYEAEFRLRRYDGVYRWFLSQAQARHTADGQLLRWYGTNTDIEDQKQSQRQLVAQNTRLLRTNQDLDNFVYTASHDLKQPIHNMAGIFEELTRTAYFRDPDAVKLVAMFDQALARINGTIDDLSAIVRMQRQVQDKAIEPIALANLVNEVINSLQDEVNRLGAHFDIDFSRCTTVPFVRASLQSLFYNLISNALKYAQPGRPPHIQLHCAPDATHNPVITVRDNGMGIDLKLHRAKLFQQFARFHPDIDGSGMGLYLVNRLVQQHGGRIEVESEVGQGTTFRIHMGQK